MVIKIVNEEMISLMGSETTEIKLKSGNEITIIMMAGLHEIVRGLVPGGLTILNANDEHVAASSAAAFWPGPPAFRGRTHR